MEDDILIRISEGEKISGYDIVETGIDSGGKYRKIKTPEGTIEKIYIYELRDLKKYFMDRYNKLHNYRREGDQIVLYYNSKTLEMVVVAVKEGDNLSEEPFGLLGGPVVTASMLNFPVLDPVTGVIPITEKNMLYLKSVGLLDSTTVKVMLFNKKNVGFYL